MRLKRFFQITLFTAAVVCWILSAYHFSPPHFIYRCGFFLAAIALFITAYWLPSAGWMLYLVLIPLANFPSRALMLGAHEALLFLSLIFILGWWLNHLVTRKATGMPARLVVPLVFIILTGIASCIWTALRYADFYPFLTSVFRNGWVNLAGMHASLAVQRTLLAGARFLVFPTVFWASYSLWSEHRQQAGTASGWRQLALVWSCALIPVLFVALYQYQFDQSFCMLTESAWQDAGRVSGGMTDPNALGLFLCIFIPLCVTGAIMSHGLRQMLFIAVSAVSIFVLTLSGSRSALLGLLLNGGIIGCVLCIVSLVKKRNALQTVVSASVGVLLLLFSLLFYSATAPSDTPSNNPLVQRLQEFWDRTQTSPSVSVVDRRELQWKQALAMWKDYPYAGIGMGAFPTELANYNREALMETPIDNAWNQYLNWLAELGAVGLFFWLWLYIACIREISSGMRAGGMPSVTLPDFVLLSTVAVFQVLCIFGAHLQSTEVAAGIAVMGGLLLSRYHGLASSRHQLNRADTMILILTAAVIVIAQMQNVTGPLSSEEIHRRYRLPDEYGFYAVEHWVTDEGTFAYQWSQKNAGKLIVVPKNDRVVMLKMAAMNPDVSPQQPQNVSVWIDNTYLDTFALTSPEWVEKDVYVYSRKPGPATLILECAHTWHPEHEQPPRSLGIALATEVEWRKTLLREGQGLSEWHAEVDGGHTNVLYRWTGVKAARMIRVGKSGVIELGLRVPSAIPFYRDPVSVTIMFNEKRLGVIELPRDPSKWRREKLTVPRELRGTPGILSISVSRLTSVRFKGTVRRVKVGAALAEIKTY